MARSRVKKLKDLLTNSFGDDFEIVEEHYKMLTAPGEHYGSIMLAIDLVIRRSSSRKEEIVNVVAKLIPTSQMLRDVFNISVTFKKEVSAYVDAIPELIHLQREYGVPESDILDMFPDCYGARISLNENNNTVDENAAIIFENLKTKGYIMEDRMIGFDFQHSKLILTELAKFHATGLALRLLKPQVFKNKINPSIENAPSLALLPKNFRDCIFQYIPFIPELQPLLPRLKSFMEGAFKNLQSNPLAPPSSFTTIIHSDYWVNNTMILRDKNRNPIKNKMVDLQLLRLGSAVQDLIFFLFTSVINSTLDKSYDELIRIYYGEFRRNLEFYNIDLDQFSWKSFLKEIQEIGRYEAFHILIMLKPILTERNQIKHSLEDFDEGDWDKNDLLGRSYMEKLKDTVFALLKHNFIWMSF